MKNSLEANSLVCALLSVFLSFGGTGLATLALRLRSGSDPAPMSAATTPTFSEMAVTPEFIAQGQQYFAMSCSECHGDDATGDEGPDLHNLPISNARIKVMIKKGIKGEMPTFAKKYNENQIAALVSYLRTLKQRKKSQFQSTLT